MPTIHPDDVRYLLVKSREDVRELISFIEKMERRSHIERDMLKTRIMLLDEISCDL
jgi:hypothetical protein